MHKILAIILIGLLLLSLPLEIMMTNASSMPSLSSIKNAVKQALHYILNIKRQLGTYYVISEYPALPIVVHCDSLYVYGSWHHNIWFIPGYWYVKDGLSFTGKVSGGSITTTESTSYISTTYTYYIDIIYSTSYHEYPLAKLKVEEIRTYYYGSHSYDSKVKISVEDIDTDTNIQNADLYVGGIYLGRLGEASIFETSIPTVLPAMRTSVRHVDMLAPLVLDVLKTDTTIMHMIAQFVNDTISYVWEGNPPPTHVYLGQYPDYRLYYIYDIYMPMLTGLEYMVNIKQPNGDQFFDAKWFSYGLGYDRILDMFKDNGYIESNYPAYPYRSKLVGGATASGALHLNGGDLFLFAESRINDPLYYAWWGLYYCSQGKYNDAVNEWNKIVSHWDGNGIYMSGQQGYSTVRLAAAIALGSILAGQGKISWDTVDQMVNVLLQLQWTGIGHYSPDGSTVYTVVKPDHIGGFLVSYGPIGSYGFVPFRPRLIEDILDYASSPPEYGGPLPTNAETTLLSMIALMQYAYWRYDVIPPELLQ